MAHRMLGMAWTGQTEFQFEADHIDKNIDQSMNLDKKMDINEGSIIHQKTNFGEKINIVEGGIIHQNMDFGKKTNIVEKLIIDKDVNLDSAQGNVESWDEKIGVYAASKGCRFGPVEGRSWADTSEGQADSKLAQRAELAGGSHGHPMSRDEARATALPARGRYTKCRVSLESTLRPQPSANEISSESQGCGRGGVSGLTQADGQTYERCQMNGDRLQGGGGRANRRADSCAPALVGAQGSLRKGTGFRAARSLGLAAPSSYKDCAW